MGNTLPSIKPNGAFVISNVADGDHQLFVCGLSEKSYLESRAPPWEATSSAAGADCRCGDTS